MPKTSESSLQSRLDRVDRLLQQHLDGLSEAEIAQRLGFERRTTHNYLRELEAQGKTEKEGKLWYPLPHGSIILRRLDLPPEEAMVLYLAARLMVKQSDQRNEAAESVLVKLADMLSNDAGLEHDLLEAATELAQRPREPGYEDVFRTVMRGYLYRRRIQILYRPYRGEPFETVFSPYLLEPSAIGFTTYAIGHSSVVDALRTFKLERIGRAKLLLNKPYDIPPDFPGLELLRNAWSIFYGEDVTRVVLRFHPDVARRVRESTWHPSQEISDDLAHPEHVLLTVQVADTTDLKPWIRGWGAACEVLEPVDLREDMMGEARRLAHLYGWHTTTGGETDHARFNDIFGDDNR